ncbi:uncharacterized protein LOC108095745 [Drosophila ficusphila]|uniref:uncharacterized protein LOC108095745 n=1 Tax=Drosophila ficusphila TaxID=30025 RepID=UPI0007E6E7BB|nr:uncharacterized protein LOC108095745 [Drosophila ficusphila]
MQLGKVIVLLLSIQQSCLALYIKNQAEKSPAKAAPKDDWGVFKNTLGLSQEKVELLKSQKDQEGTKELLNRFILENPKALPQAKKRPDQFLGLYRSILKKLTASKQMLKTSLNFELADRPNKTLKRPRRKIAVKMVSDMPSWKIESLLNSFYLKHGIPRNTEEHEYPDLDLPRDTDYESDNFYDDEGDVGLTAKDRQNSEYGSFQDLIMQAKMNEWEREHEETKLHSSDDDDYI